MAERTVKYPSSSLSDSSELVPRAQDVAIERGIQVTEVLFLIAAIRSLQTNSSYGAHAQIDCVAAQVQDTKAQFGQQAAHLLPGQILVARQPVWDLALVQPPPPGLSDELSRLAEQTKMRFAGTNVLPAVFNRADSQAESLSPRVGVLGLKELFAATVRSLWSSARVDAARPLVIDRRATLDALRTWFAGVNRVYTEASRAKARAATVQTGQRGQDRSDEAVILATYADSFRIVNVAQFAAAYTPQVYLRYASLT